MKRNEEGQARIEMENQTQNGQESSRATYHPRLSVTLNQQRIRKRLKTIDTGRLSLRSCGGNSRSEKELREKLGNAIRMGNLCDVRDIMNSNELSMVINLRFCIDINVYRLKQRCREYVRPETQLATMEVSPLQLAVILKKVGIVQLMLQLVPDQEMNTFIGKSNANVKFKEDLSNYGDLDRMLNGPSAFQLAARFHAESLKMLMNYIKDQETIGDYIIKGGQSGYSALHYAACNKDTEGLR